MTDKPSLKIFEVELMPLLPSTPDAMQCFCICARSRIEAYLGAIDCICLSIPTSAHEDWIVKEIRLVKDYAHFKTATGYGYKQKTKR